jgi:hypothetical protein
MCTRMCRYVRPAGRSGERSVRVFCTRAEGAAVDSFGNLRHAPDPARRQFVRTTGVKMKFIVQWSTRPGSEAKDNLKSSESLLKAFGSWTPPSEWTISEFINRVDGRGGLLICETDDLASIDRAVAQFLPWLDYDIIPVVDIADSVANLAAGNAWARSAGGID